jgi:prephenate dehydrogenase
MTAGDPRSAVVIGAGLIGTSIGLALRSAGWQVHLEDRDPVVAGHAADLGAGVVDAADVDVVELVVVSVPPSATVAAAREALARFPRATVTDVASIKAKVLDGVQGAPGAERFVGGHPLAGREVSGPDGARGDLFEGRVWVLTPNGASTEAVALLQSVVVDAGATPVVMTAPAHDRAVALVSHVPQVMASLTAARLIDADEESVALSGQGIRDVTRIAASDPDLWSDIIDGNAPEVRDVLTKVRDDLSEVLAAMDEGAQRSAVHSLVDRGNHGHARIPGKHGDRPQRYTDVPVVIPDSPGALARLFEHAGDHGINIEDLLLEHSPGQPVGLATLRVMPDVADELTLSLRTSGWTVHR